MLNIEQVAPDVFQHFQGERTPRAAKLRGIHGIL
jgi:hypothetical protein